MNWRPSSGIQAIERSPVRETPGTKHSLIGARLVVELELDRSPFLQGKWSGTSQPADRFFGSLPDDLLGFQWMEVQRRKGGDPFLDHRSYHLLSEECLGLGNGFAVTA